MPRCLRSKLLLLAPALLTLSAALPLPAHADDDSRIKFDAGALAIKKPPPGLPDVKPVPTAWPRLDPGAVLCRTGEDLQRLAARRSGQTVDGTVDCQIIRVPTAISIVQRKTPGMTEVKVTGAAGDAGWTDAWLPARAPAGTTSASR